MFGRAFLFVNHNGCRKYAAVSKNVSHSRQKHITKFPVSIEPRTLCQQYQVSKGRKAQRYGFAVAIKANRWRADKKIRFSTVPLIYKTHTTPIYFRLMWNTWCFVRVQYRWLALTSPRFPFGSRFFIRHTHTHIHRSPLGETFSGNQSSLFGYFFTCEIPQIGRRGDRRLDDPRTALLMDAHSDSGRAEAKRIRLRSQTLPNHEQFTSKPLEVQACKVY